MEVGTPHCDLQSGGGRQQSGPPVDAYVIEFGHDWTAVGALLVRWKVTNCTDSADYTDEVSITIEI